MEHAGIVGSQRGPDGGYRLARAPADVTLADVIRVVDGPIAAVAGVRPEDVSYPPGAEALPGVWLEARGMLRSVLETTTFADLVERFAGSRPVARDRAGRYARRADPAMDQARLPDLRQRLAQGGLGHRPAADRFQEESIEQLSVGEEDVDVVASCNALDLLGGPRLVLVRGAEALSDEDAAAIAAYLQSPTPDTCLALFGGGGIDPKSPLVRAVEAVGEARFFDAPDRKQAADWVVKRFAAEGVSCSMPVARRLVELVGEDMGELAPEVEKLIVFARGEAPEVEDVEALVPPQVEIKPWEITDAWGGATLHR